ncbi:MAG: PSD1 and planctomycete cytochrome C domain-containing protein [Planctomycetaceae bacterium]
MVRLTQMPAFLILSLLITEIRAADQIDFNRDVRPILSDACFSCHGPDNAHRQADLRLDQSEGLFRSVDGVTIVDRKQPEHSELLKRILSDDPDIVMPPSAGTRRLSDHEKDVIRRWIAEGAEWKGHWAYIPPVRPAIPDVEGTQSSNPVDRFIQRQLAQKQITALESADPVTRIRRLSLDLTGLPPTPQQVQAFVSDPSPERWQAAIDDLLASTHYAERMTAFWLDLVRYADTNGIHGDNHREVWMYRDYVIEAFHRNMPFDQFTIEQLAGDLLPDATDEQKIASGYNRLLLTTREGGAQPKEYLAKYSADRVRNAASVWLGATMGCCECHDHKFDPFSLRDFYTFAAFFADVQDVAVGVQPSVKMPSRAQKTQMAELDQQLQNLQQQLDTQTPELDAALQMWAQALSEKVKTQLPIWNAVRLTDMTSSGGQTFTVQPDGSILTSGTQPKHDTYTLTVSPAAGNITAVRLETFRDDSFAKKSLSRPPGNGNFVLSDVRVTLLRAADQSETNLKVADAQASIEQKDWPISGILDGRPETGWAVDGHNDPPKEPIAVLRFAEAVSMADGDRLRVELIQAAVDYHNIGRFRLTASTSDRPGPDEFDFGVPNEHLATIRSWPEVPDDQKQSLAKFYRSIAPALDGVRKQYADASATRQTLERQIPETLITRTQPPREIRVLARGNWMDDSGELVAPQVPAFLPQLTSDQRLTRMDLANWLVDGSNPLVARVFVNRLWQILFGRGLVKSSDDFGSQGSWPTHPDLLDWLAVEFRESGWNVQHIIRLIVTSDAYQRSSVTTPELREADPFNTLLARQSRFRLDAEFIRDLSLSVSGLLVDRSGGPSVKPYQPAGYWEHLNFPKREWQADSGENQYRRGLYTYWCRTFLHPAMRSFDAPTREECTVDRPRSNNSLQALVLLNDPSYVEAARALAARVLVEGGSDDRRRIEFLLTTCLSRSPRPEEFSVLTELVNSQRQQFAQTPDAARQFLEIGQSRQTGDPAELAAWTAVARVILNLHETITRS